MNTPTLQEILCWHKFTVKSEMLLKRNVDNRTVGVRYFLMCNKCGATKIKDTQ